MRFYGERTYAVRVTPHAHTQVEHEHFQCLTVSATNTIRIETEQKYTTGRVHESLEKRAYRIMRG